ncbi:MAG: hypothetical protein Q4E54_08500 [Lachnospiraceae bacterium]|nr:hypothetical protein [Lachnospiraceae bacterium]
MKDGTFRKKKGFTAVQNSVAKDKTLSMKAKGLYLLIQAYITMPGTNWKKSDFEGMCMEGSKAFNSAWDELKKKGYLHVHIYSGNGVFRNEYELLDEKNDGPHTFYYNCKGELTKTNEDRYPQNGSNANGTNGNGIDADGNNGEGSNANGSNNINTMVLKPDNKTINNPSINLSENIPDSDWNIHTDDGIDGWNDIVEYREKNGKLPYDEILKSSELSEKFADKLIESCGHYDDPLKQSILDTLSVAVKEMLDEIPTRIQGRNVDAAHI